MLILIFIVGLLIGLILGVAIESSPTKRRERSPSFDHIDPKLFDFPTAAPALCLAV